MKNDKIVLCCHIEENVYVGGVATMVKGYLSHNEDFSKRGFDVTLFDYHPEKRKFKSSLFNNLDYAKKQKKALDKYLKTEKSDILHIHTSREFLFFKDVFLGGFIAKKHNKKVVLTVHVGDAATVFKRIPRFFKKPLISILNRRFSKVIFLSEHIFDQFVALGLDKSKGEVLYNYFDFGGKDVIRQESKCGSLDLVFIGMINRDKGIIELLKAVEKIGNDFKVHLDVCGTVTDRSVEEEFNSLISRLSDKVTVHGYVDTGKKAELLCKADVLILPSYHEGFPLVIPEALSCGCAIIATPVGAIPEVLDGNNYVSVKVGSIDDIKTAILSLYNDSEKLNALKKNNLEKSKLFGIEEHIAKLCEIYSCLEK